VKPYDATDSGLLLRRCCATTVCRFVAGEGTRLFADTGIGPLHLVEATAVRSGVVLQRYRP